MTNTAGRKMSSIMQNCSAAILRQLPMIDRVRNEEGMREALEALLQSLGNYSGADRAYLLDRIEGAEERYRCVYEWCKPDMVQGGREAEVFSLTGPEMPCMIEILRRGECVVVRDIEQVRETMPVEYTAMRTKRIHAEIVAPIFSRNELSGMIGLDNPHEELTELFIHQLAFVGAHLNSARQNMRMFHLLEQRQYTLEDNLRALEKERQVMMVLCEDSIAVYRADLKNDTIEPVKLSPGANAAKFIAETDIKLRYYDQIRHYFEHYVSHERAPDFLHFFEAAHLMQLLKDRDRVVYRYESEPNGRGQIYFEVRITKIIQTEKEFRVLLDFRHIGDIVAEERKHQQALEAALDAARQNNEIISAISKIYFSIYRIDLRRMTCEEITSDSADHRAVGRREMAAIRMTWQSRDKIQKEFLPYAERFFDLSTLAERLREDDTVALEYRITDGNWHHARFIAQTCDADGTPTQVLCVVRQTSEEKRREEKWIVAAEEAQRANEAKSEFLSRMTHDIRTPMNVIVGFTNIARQHLNEPEKLKDCLDKIQMSGENLGQLVDDVLDISRIESGRFEIAVQPVDLHELFVFYRQTVRGMLVEKRLNFTSEIHDLPFPRLMGDRVRLGQICMNLLSNAVKYTPEGGSVRFEIFERPAEAGQVELVTVVQDTGIGMTPEFMEQMYTQFSRAVDTRVNKVQGTGLGLAIVKKIVDLMGGTIEAESAPQQGTTFTVRLTLPVADPTDMALTVEAVGLPDRTLQLLVAEDNDLNYEIADEQLAEYGLHCVRAVDGRDAVEQFRAARPDAFDAILMDLQMPGMNGLEATAAIRALNHPQAQTIPIIALTANAYQEDAARCIAAGMNAHLSKPLDVGRLLRTLAELIQ